MSNEHDNSLGTVAAIGVAILLLLVVLVVPAGFGLFYFSRSQVQRAVLAEQQARADAELAQARAAVQSSIAQSIQSNSSPSTLDLTIDVASDGTITIKDEKIDLDQLAEKISARAKIIVYVDPQCPATRLGEICDRCLSAGASGVNLFSRTQRIQE